jgi:hypothetical protein
MIKNRPYILAALLVASCGPAEEREARGQDVPADAAIALTGGIDLILEREMGRIDAEAARIDSIFQPLPLLQPTHEDALRRFGNPQQLERARALGVERLLPPDRLNALRRDGALILLEDTDYWVVRDLDYSQPLSVPAIRSLLTEIGERFQGRLAELGAPAFRLEVTSVLRTAGDQEALRRVNPNAATGESTHEYGTTVDVLYSAFSAPAQPIVELDVEDAEWLIPYLHRYAAVAAERVAARRALEIKALLGQVLIALQDEGKVMVTIERLQPVYHMTVSQDF